MPTRWPQTDSTTETIEQAQRAADRRLVLHAFEVVRNHEKGDQELSKHEEELLSEAADLSEIICLDLLSQSQSRDRLDNDSKEACEIAFKLLRWMSLPDDWESQLKHVLRGACYGILAERTGDTKHWLKEIDDFPQAPEGESWADKVFMHVASAFLRGIRQGGWDDMDSIARDVQALRESQALHEAKYLDSFEDSASRAAIELVAFYHWAKSAELVSQFLAQGTPEDLEAQLQFHFNRSQEAIQVGWLGEMGTLLFLTERAAFAMIARSVWRTLGPLGDHFVKFLKRLVDREKDRPIFELLPPQKQALDMNLMDIAQRAVVIQMPTSSGKTLLAQFRILQTKQAFADAMIVYLVPTRALVNQVTVQLRQELSPLGINVELAAPAFELDPSEEEFLLSTREFDVLVTTPEKMDLLTRSGRLAEVGRHLGLVIADEAHNIGADERGLRIEILLATISREFPDARFLLLSPFVPNVEELGRWLGDNRNVSLSVHWRPNEKLIGLCYPKGRGRNWEICIESLFTPPHLQNIHLEESTLLESGSVAMAVDKPNSKLSKRDIAAATAAVLSDRGNVLVMTADPSEAHDVAYELDDLLSQNMNGSNEDTKQIDLVQRFVSSELGDQFLLSQLLQRRIAFHHAGLSPEARFLVEWLMAGEQLRVLVATSTLAQGVNFPVSSVILTSHTQHGGIGVGRLPMPMEQFWNIAGRCGRLNQDLLGLALFASKKGNDGTIRKYVNQEINELASYLESMVDAVLKVKKELDLDSLVHTPGWSTFAQFIAHAYNVADRPADFEVRTESILLSTLGYRRLSSKRPEEAQILLQATRNYARQLKRFNPGVLDLVDNTGFSPNTINMLLSRGEEIRKNLDEWTPSGLFSTGNQALRSLIGVLLRVNELNFDSDEEGFGQNISRIVASWVRGESVSEIAQKYFSDDDPTKSVTECCRRLFGNILPNATWGFGALQSLGIDKDELQNMSKAQQLEISSIPAMVYYGVDTLDGVIMRNLNVPRLIANQMGVLFGQEYKVLEGRMSLARDWLTNQSGDKWQEAVPTGSNLSGAEYKEIWSIINGFE